MSSNDEQVCKKMTRAIMIAKNAWADSNMPGINDLPEETGKISISMLAVKIYDELADE